MKLSAVLLFILPAFVLAGCNGPKVGTVRSKGKPIETPCNGTMLARHAYSVCNEESKSWHVVEDAYYSCRSEKPYRVSDHDTRQPCGSGQVPPQAVGTIYKNLHGSGCQSPAPAYTAVIWQCKEGVWQYAKVKVDSCVEDGKTVYGVIGNVNWISTTADCEDGGTPPFDMVK